MTFIPRTQLGEHSRESRQEILNSVDKILCYVGEVRSNDDPLDSGRIKVRIKGLDDKIDDRDLVYCDPEIPKFFHCIPQVGEGVRVYLQRQDKTQTKRTYVGPIISQFQRLNKDPLFYTAFANTEYGQADPLPGVSSIPEAEGIYPKKDEIAFMGRDNADLIFKPREVLIRAGKFEYNNNVKANLKNPSYIQLKLTSSGKTSYSNIVADKIFLLSHLGNPKVPVILTEEDLKKIEERIWSSVRGELLVQFLKLMQSFVGNHRHPYATLPPNPGAGKVPEILNFNLDEILSKNIKIN